MAVFRGDVGSDRNVRSLPFLWALSSTCFWKLFMGFVFVTMLVRQYQFSNEIVSYESKVFGVGETRSTVVAINRNPGTKANTAVNEALGTRIASAGIPDLSLTKTKTTEEPEQRLSQNQTQQQHYHQHPLTNYSSSPNLLNFGKRWKNDLRKKLREQERIRGRRTKPKSKKRAQIHEDFNRLNTRLEEINTSQQIDDPNYWHSVTPQNYQETLKNARSSMDEMVDQVYTDCILWLVPPKGITAMEVELDDRNATSDEKNSLAGPELRFQCGSNSRSNDLQYEPCDSANLCKVRSDPRLWRKYYSSASTTEKTTSHYNHTGLEERLMPSESSKTDSSSSHASALLTMVDTVQYLRYGKSITSTGKEQIFIWECFLNKASYALRTNRDFYIWIGEFEEDEKSSNSKSILHQRNTETISRTFGANCNPESKTKNVVHYYKPIAFGTFFQKIVLQREASSAEDPRAWFVDADIYFNREAFPSTNTESPERVMSLDDYFDISPQASLLGSQNPSGKSENILINGGLLGLRNRSNKDNNDDWVLDFSALWWYCRCGERDQIALWLLLFATWSAESSLGSGPQFSYPGVAFENYFFAWFAVIPHARTFLPSLQQAWAKDTAPPMSNPADSVSSWTTVPTNASLFNGGDGFLKSPRGGVFTFPLELPHVLLLPLDPFVLPPQSLKPESSSVHTYEVHSRRSDFHLGIVLKEQPGKKALLTHNKNMRDACYDFRCWPFLIREDRANILSSMNITETD